LVPLKSTTCPSAITGKWLKSAITELTCQCQARCFEQSAYTRMGDMTNETVATVVTVADADALMAKVREAAGFAHEWMLAQTGDPLAMLRKMKFECVGFHPVDYRPINLVEQINQTWTFATAIAAARQLLVLHPEAGGFRLAPGAHAALPLDIMSVKEGLVGAETFAAVSPHNNGKLEKDLEKLKGRAEKHRYVFFMSPQFPGNKRLSERNGIQVWSVDL
jgi:hypothetical protein